MQIKKAINFKDSLHFTVFDLLNKQKEWGLSLSELKVLASIYDKDFELLDIVKDTNLRMKILFSKETKDDIMNKHNMSYNTLNNILSVLRKKDIIKDNKINENLLFSLNKDNFTFTIVFINDKGTTNREEE